MSSAVEEAEGAQISKWVAPNVGGGSTSHEPVSEAAIAALREKARAEGHAQGFQTGLSEAKELTQARVQLFDRLSAHLSEPLAKLEPEAMQVMAGLSLQVAQAIISREVSMDETLVLRAIRSALDTFTEKDRDVRISVCPADFELVKTTYAELENAINHTVVADASIGAGGAVVESGSVLIDAQVETRISALLDELMNQPEANDD